MEPWIAKTFPHAVSVVLHLDEATPHYQIIDVPLDSRGKLNCRGIYGGKQALQAWQDRAAEPVAHLGIVRGLAGSVASHERVKTFYNAVNAPTPPIPSVTTPRPQPMPPRTVAEQIPLSAAKAERDELEQAAAAQRKQRDAEKAAQAKAVMQAWPATAAKAKAVELEQRRRQDAEANTARLASMKSQADKLRALSIDQVLRRVYGAELEKGSHSRHASRKYLLQDGRKIGVSSGREGADVWVEQGGAGKRGAINLVMHLDGLDYRSAVRLLAEHFDSSAVAAEHAGELVKQAAADVQKIGEEPVAAPAPDATKWPYVRRWLHEVRGMPWKIIDKLHSLGLVYADSKANATFKRAQGGAFQRGTRDTKFHRAIGGAACSPFIVPGAGPKVILVEAPLDAIAVAAAHPGAMAIASGGDQLPPEKLTQWIPEEAEIFAGYDADRRGDQVARKAEETLNAKRLKPNRKDWSETIKSEPWRVDARWADPVEDQEPRNAPRPVLKPT